MKMFSIYELIRVFFMDIPNDSIIERTTLRFLDPVSGERYHVLFNPPPTQEIRDRLVQKPSDSESSITKRINEYYAEIRNLLDYYENNSIHINADQDPNIVFECIESGIVNPMQKSIED
jgi:adenylate kinase